MILKYPFLHGLRVDAGVINSTEADFMLIYNNEAHGD